MSQHADHLERAGDGSPRYHDTVHESHRRLQYRLAIYSELPRRGSGIRLAIYQAEAACGEGATEKNLKRMEEAVAHAARFEAQLLVFPELYLPGYTHDPESARAVSEYVDGPSLTRAREVARANQMGLVLPYAEKLDDEDGRSRYYDSVAVIDERGELLDSYRKTHLYAQQERDNWNEGHSEFPVHRIAEFPVGVLNCYECEFPELVRILALRGAKLVVGPTAADTYYRLPDGRRSRVPYPDVSRVVLPGHAYVNNLFFAYSNRCGYESRGEDVWHYRGNSIVIGPHGDPIVAAAESQDTLLVADCVPALYGRTHPEPGYFYLKDRRPELYEALVARDARFVDIENREVEETTDLFGDPHRYRG